MPAPALIHYDDVAVGETMAFGRHTITKEEIVAFARAFDPQPIHLDEEAAKRSMIGRLCASGWHGCAILMRMLATDVLARAAALGSPGVEEGRFVKPVFPGDTLSGRLTCLAKRPLRSRPGVGICRVRIEMVDGAGAVTTSWDTHQLLRIRDQRAVERDAAPEPAAAAATLPPTADSARAAAAHEGRNHLEDLAIGAVAELGSHTFTRPEIIDFASRFDPQPFHLEDAAAAASLFGGLSASGWHTAAVWLRHQLDHRRRLADRIELRGGRPARYGPSPGFEKLRWLRPVLAGDTIRYTARVREKIRSRSRPDVGLVLTDCEGINQKGEVAFALVSKVFVERRAAG